MNHLPEMQCGVCRKNYSPTRQYLHDYAGRSVRCECGALVPVPPIPASATSSDQPIRATSATGWQDAGYVVAQKGLKLPRRCLKCNAPVSTLMQSLTLRWLPEQERSAGRHALGLLHGGSRATHVAGLVQGAIAKLEEKLIVVRIGYCPDHTPRWNKWWLGGIFAAIALASLLAVMLVASFSRQPGAILIVLMVLFVASAVLAIMFFKKGPPIQIVHFHQNRAWLDGFCPAYVETLPPLSEAVNAENTRTADALNQLTLEDQE